MVEEDSAEWMVSETHDEIFSGWKVEILSFHSDRVNQKIDKLNQNNLLQAKNRSAKGGEWKYAAIELSEKELETIEWLSLDCTEADKDAVWHSDSEIKIDRYGYVVRNGKKTEDRWDACICSEQKPLRLKIRNICGDESVYVL